MDYQNYYRTLGIDRDASGDEIKQAYRRLARKYHPDVSKEPDAEKHFKAVKEAYEVLSDPEKRATYDNLGQWAGGAHGGGRPPRSREAPGGGSFSDFFETFFGRRGKGFRGFGSPGRDQSAKILITLEDAVNGASRMFSLEIPELDEGGRSRTRHRRLRVRIPPGVTQGTRIRLTGQGSPGSAGGPPGDLYLEVDLQPHPLFRVNGQDIELDLPVTPWEAALGETVTVPTLRGQVRMRIPAGSQSGRRFRLKGRGLPGESPGDQYVVMQIHTPPADRSEAKTFYHNMKHEMPFDPRKGLGM